MTSFLLDTNILSEGLRLRPDPRVQAWFQSHDMAKLYATTFAIAEIHVGIEMLPVGRRRMTLVSWLETSLLRQFDGRLLTFELKAAAIWGQMVSQDRRKGRPRPIVDSMIAAIAMAHDMTVVTRNAKDFADLDLKILNPFEPHG